MLVIRPEQFSAFEAQQMRSFLDRVIAFLREYIPDVRKTPDEELRSSIEPLVLKARGYGLTTEQQAVSYILLAKHLGTDFDETVPHASTTLTSNRLSANAKLDRLQGLLV